MLLSDYPHESASKEQSQEGTRGTFTEVYLFQSTGFLQMAKAGYGTCCRIS